MGRYYTGDIDGKFWFGVQSSSDADFFGVIGQLVECEYDDGDGTYEELRYSFDVHDLPLVEEGIAKCRAFLGTNEKDLDEFFAKNNGYNDQMLSDAGFKLREIPKLMEWYARLKLGLKIKQCLNKEGKCQFEAEL